MSDDQRRAGPDEVDDAGDPTAGRPGDPGPAADRLLVGDALREAAARLGRPIGLALVAAYLLVGFAGAVATTSLVAAIVPRLRTFVLENSAASPGEVLPPIEPSPLALQVAPSTALGLVLLTGLLAETLNVLAVQIFVRDGRTFPRSALADLPARSLVSFVANSLANVAIFVGFLAFVLPGVFLAVAFYLVRAVVAVEGAGVGPALRRSWRLVAGHRLRVLVVLLVVVLVGQVAALPGGAVEVTPLGATAAAMLGVGLGAVVTAFGAAVAARVYVQLVGIDAAWTGPDGAQDGRTTGDRDDTGAEEEPIGALTPEEIDERFGGR